METQPLKHIEHIEHFESRYKRHYDKHMQAMTDFSVECLHDEQILKAMAFCECQRLGRYLREDVLTSPNCNDELKKARASVVSRIHDFGISDRLPDINDRVNRIVNRDCLDLLDDLLTNK